MEGWEGGEAGETENRMIRVGICYCSHSRLFRNIRKTEEIRAFGLRYFNDHAHKREVISAILRGAFTAHLGHHSFLVRSRHIREAGINGPPEAHSRLILSHALKGRYDGVESVDEAGL